MPKKTFHSLAHYIVDYRDHPYTYQLTCQEAIQPLVDEFHVYTLRDTRIHSLPPGWKPWFSKIYNKKGRKAFFRECCSLLRQPAEKKEKRIFFLEFFGYRDLRLFLIAARAFSRRRDEFWLLHRDDLEIRRKKEKNWHLFLARAFRCFFGKRYRPFTDSESLKCYYEKKLGCEFHLLPVVETHLATRRAASEKMICTLPGRPRPEKGEREIQELAHIADSTSENFVLDISGAMLLDAPRNALTIQRRSPALSREEYWESLFKADFVLLPYDPVRYKNRTSGIFVESVVAGKIPLVKKGSWLAQELIKFQLEELIVDWERPDFFSHLQSLQRDQAVKKKLEVMQKAYAERHSVTAFSSSVSSVLC